MTTGLHRTSTERAAAVGVITVDDQAAFRRVARDVIEATRGFVCLGEAACGEEAQVLADRLDPDLVLVDVRMPGLDGLETARRLSVAHPESTIVLLSSDELDAASPAIRSSGATAFLSKRHLGPARLERLWAEHGRRPPSATG
jgi:DNA-binding NarL/FixJ family response regulator